MLTDIEMYLSVTVNPINPLEGLLWKLIYEKQKFVFGFKNVQNPQRRKNNNNESFGSNLAGGS